MASSLSELLAEEGFHRRQKSVRDNKDQSVAIPLYICQTQNSSKRRDRPGKSSTRNGSSSVFSSRRVGSVSERSNSKSSVLSEFTRRDDYPAVDEVSVRAVVSILSGYVGRYVKDESFREKVREKCLSCLVATKVGFDDEYYEVLEKLEMGIESVDRLVDERGAAKRETRSKRARNTVQILSIVVASLNNERSSNSHLICCAQLYLAIVYKLERSDMRSARHLLEVFFQSPFLARTHLVPDLWEHFFLPHLLHLKVWYAKEVEYLGDMAADEKETKMKALSKAYNEQVDMGTIEFALYYKKWFKVGVVGSLPVPAVPLPDRPYPVPRRPSMDSSSTNSSSVNKNLYNVVFGSANRRQSANFAERGGGLKDLWNLDEEDSHMCVEKDSFKNKRTSSLHERGSRRRSSSQHERSQRLETWRDKRKPENFRFFGCQQSLPLQLECSKTGNHLPKNNSMRKKEETTNLSAHIIRAADCICSSDSLTECEFAIRIIAKSWLDLQANPALELALSKPPVIEGMLEVLFASEDDEVLELVLSILAELVTRNELNRLIVLNADAQFEILRKHLRSSSLFLKAAVLLYLVKPRAKQMISAEWVALVLRVMEFGDQMQTLFTVRCSPLAAAFYLLDQLLTGFDEDRNLDNARQVVCLGGLSILAGKISTGDAAVRFSTVVFILCCVRADGSCRSYLVENFNVGSLVELVVIECRRNPGGPAFALFVELLRLNSRTQINSIIGRLKQGWGGFSTMHILFAYLQQAKPEDRPLVAAVLLQLDLLEDPSKHSIFREEAIEAVTTALEFQTHDPKLQEKCSRALLMLGGRFSYTGDASIESWLLRKAGFNEVSPHVYKTHESGAEEEAEESWQRKAAAVLLRSGGKRLLAALAESITNGVPSLSRASLVTVSWMLVYIRALGDDKLASMATSVLVRQLVESLSYAKDVEGRVIASYSLLNLTKHNSGECVSMLLSWGKDELMSHLKHLSLVTWTANELLTVITSLTHH